MTEPSRPKTDEPALPEPPPWFVQRRKRTAPPPSRPPITVAGEVGSLPDSDAVSPVGSPAPNAPNASTASSDAPGITVSQSLDGHKTPLTSSPLADVVAAVVVDEPSETASRNGSAPVMAGRADKRSSARPGKPRRAAAVKPTGPRSARPRSAAPTSETPTVPGNPQEQLDDALSIATALTRRQRIWRWSRGVILSSYGTSLVLHALLLLVLALCVKATLSGSLPVIEASLDDGEADVVLDDSFEELEISDPAPDEDLKPPPIEVAPQPTPDEAFRKSLNDLQPRLPGPGGSGTDSLPPLFLPRGGNAVSKGSFTVWTNPRDPKPLEAYFIVIQIKVPATLRRYPLSDLDGEVVGTDGYHQKLPVDWTKRGATLGVKNGRLVPLGPNDDLPVFKGLVQIRIRVPGATRLVQDTVKLSSKMLRESQTLHLTF